MVQFITASSEKPLLRGFSHQLAAFAALAAGALLVAASPTALAAIASVVYGATLALMFGASAAYHRGSWGPVASARMRRLDHAAIFLIIAGTYTPLCLLGIGGASGTRLLLIAWTGALAGILRATLWVHAPRALSAILYVALGWIVLGYLPELRAGAGLAGMVLLGIGGLLYTVGAVIYALRRPDPWPKVFGYHEIFHALVIAASLCHFVVVLLLVRAARA